jgi:hypothetical protein
MYFVRLGFLDGRAGWHLARLMACYEYMIGLLYKEKGLRGRAAVPAAAPAGAEGEVPGAGSTTAGKPAR